MKGSLRTVMFETGTIARRMGRAIVFTCLCLLFCSVLLFDTAFTGVCQVYSHSGLMVKVVPPIQDVALGQRFTVEVVVDGTVDLGAFEFRLIYDPAVAIVERVELGLFLGSTGRTAQPIAAQVDNEVGEVTFAAFSFGDQSGPQGVGTLATIELSAVGVGTTPLDLEHVLLTDTMASAQAAFVENGVVTVGMSTVTHTPTVVPTLSREPTPSTTATPPVAVPTPTCTATATEVPEPTSTTQIVDTPTRIPTSTAVEEPSQTLTLPAVPTATSTVYLASTPTPTTIVTATSVRTETPVPTPYRAATTHLRMETPSGRPAVTSTVDPLDVPTSTEMMVLTLTFQPAKGLLVTAKPGVVEQATVAPDRSTFASGWEWWILVVGMALLTAAYIVRVLVRGWKQELHEED